MTFLENSSVNPHPENVGNDPALNWKKQKQSCNATFKRYEVTTRSHISSLQRL